MSAPARPRPKAFINGLAPAAAGASPSVIEPAPGVIPAIP